MRVCGSVAVVGNRRKTQENRPDYRPEKVTAAGLAGGAKPGDASI